jgi:glycerophosphoryl diester phosphodiesterase
MLVAHRGGAKLAPENTVVAFQAGVSEWGADMLEMDVRLTRCGQVVVFHDATLERTTNGSGLVADHTLEQIRALDAGYHFVDSHGRHSFRGQSVGVPTLAEVLEACPDVRINVEVKEARVAAPLVEVIDRQAAHDRVLIAAELEAWRRDARGYQGPWGASRAQSIRFWITHRLPGGGPYTPVADVFQLPEFWKGQRILSKRFIREAQRRNIPVQVWTVDDPDDMRRLLAWGADGIQTDRPDLLARVLTEVSGRPPPPSVWRAEASV